MECLHPQEIDLGLARIEKVAHALGLQKGQAKVVTVAGTNGKGSCIATLECCLLGSGQRVGCYTSPHLLRYQERVRINGRDVSEQALCDVFDRIDRAREAISLTYFEFGTLAAMLLFQQADVDVWLLEVGLGGRLDAVNIIDPDIAVITSIDLDHQDWLGDTRDQIAQEKLGILRPGITCVCAEAQLTPSMTRAFDAHAVDLYLINRDFSITTKDYEVSVRRGNGVQTASLPLPRLPMPSVAAALQVMALYQRDFNVADGGRYCENLSLAGRYESLQHRGVSFILDVAHNPAATRLLAETVAKRKHAPVFAVVAMMADKDIDEALRPLLPHVAHWVVCACEGVARSAHATDVARSLRGQGIADDCITVCHTVEEALAYCIEHAEPSGIVHNKNTANTTLVFGSFYTVAAAKTYLQPETTPSESN